jgi:hypothetical protein
MTLKELITQYESKIIADWDHTAVEVCSIYNLNVTVIRAFGSKAKPRKPEDFHPFRKKRQEGLKVTRENIDVLRVMAGAMLGQR